MSFKDSRFLSLHVFAVASLLGILNKPGYAAQTVSLTTDTPNNSPPGELRYALENFNPSGDTIVFSSGINNGTITLSAPLPIINLTSGTLQLEGQPSSYNITIDGNGNPIFFVQNGTLQIQTFNSLTLQNATAHGGNGGASISTNPNGGGGGAGGGGGGLGAGGALFINNTASITVSPDVSNFSISNNSAIGGAGATGGGFDPIDPLCGAGGGGGGGMFSSGGDGGDIGFLNVMGFDNYAGGGGGGGGGSTLGASGTSGIVTDPDQNATGGTGGAGGGPSGGSGGVGGFTTLPIGQFPNPVAGGVGQSTGVAFCGGGGGGGAVGLCRNDNPQNGGNGGSAGDFSGGGGGGGGTTNIGTSAGGGNGGIGGFGGGGGGAGIALAVGNVAIGVGGDGNFGGGGGGGGDGYSSGDGGGKSLFGGGVGGDSEGTPAYGGPGGGGAGLGGGIFIRSGASLTLNNPSFSGNSATGGAAGVVGGGIGGNAGATNGIGAGPDIFMMSGSSLTVNVTGTSTIASTIASDNGAGGGSKSSGGLFIAGGGTLVLSGVNNSSGYTGGTTINQGTLSISNDNNLGNGGSISFDSPGPGTLQFTGSTSSNRPIALNTNGIIQVLGSNTVTLSGMIGGSGGSEQGGLICSGPGTLILSSSQNNYIGGTSINGGTLALSGAGALLNSGTVGVYTGGTFDISASSGPVTIGNLIGTGGVSLGSGSLILGTATPSVTFSGAIGGLGGSLTKQGSGTFILSGSNNYSGATTLNAGTLSISSSSNLSGTSSLQFNGGIFQSTGTFTFSPGITLNPGGGSIDVTLGNTLTLSGVITSSGSLTKIDSGILVLNNASNNYSGSTNILGGTLSVSNIGNLGGTTSITLDGGSLQIAAALSLPGSMGVTLGSNGGTFDTDGFNSSIGGQVTSSGSLTKINSGVLTLSNATNNYSGSTNILGGTLSISNAANLGATTSLVLNNGTLQMTSPLSLPGSIGVTLGSSGGTFDTAGANSSIGGQVTSSGAFSKINGGVLTLSNASNNYSGPTNILGGTLSISNSGNLGTSSGISFSGGTLQSTASVSLNQPITFVPGAGGGSFDVTSGNTLTLSGAIAGTNSADPLTKTDAGTLALTGPNTYYGNTNVLGGVLSITNVNNLGNSTALTLSSSTLQLASALNLHSSVGITLSGTGGTIDTDGFNSSISGAISGGASNSLTKINSGILTLGNSSNNYSGSTNVLGGTLSINNIANLGSSTSLVLNGGALQMAAPLSLPGTIGVTLGSNGGTFDTDGFNSTVGGQVTSSGSLTKINSGVLTLSNASNNYSGSTNILGGTLSVSNIGNLGGTTSIMLNGGSLQMAAALSLPGSIGVALGSNGGTFDTDGFNSTVGGQVTSSGSLTKINGGVLTLSNPSNNYSGQTNILGGTLSISSSSNLGSTPSINFSGSTLQITAAAALPSSMAMVMNSGGGTIDTNGFNSSIGGAISGPGSLTKINPGILSLSGANSYSNGTVISGGTLALNGNGSLNPAGAVAISSGATFDLSSLSSLFLTIGDLSGAGSVALGNTAMTVGTNTPSTAFSGVISGAGSLVKEGSGTLSLSGINTYQGGTVINQGVLQLSGGGALLSTGFVEVNTAGTFDISLITPSSITIGDLRGRDGTVQLGTKTLNIDNDGFSSFSGEIIGSGCLLKQGTGTVALAGINTYQGGTTIADGTISITDDNNLGHASGNIKFTGGNLKVEKSLSLSRDIAMSGDGSLEIVLGHKVVHSGSLSGSGALMKTGFGNLKILGDSPSYSRPITVHEGILSVDGMLPSSITINRVGILGGTGSVGSVVNDGIVSPGNSIGTLSIVGNYVQNAAGMLKNEIDPAGNSSLLSITGSASLNGALDVVPHPGSYFADSNVYTILIAPGGVGGQFSSVHFLDPAGDAAFKVQYLSDRVLLSFGDNHLFSGIVTRIKQHNPRQVKKYLEKQTYFSNGKLIPEQTDLYNVIVDLSELNKHQLVSALNQLHPALFGAFSIVNNNVRSYLSSIFTRHPSEECCQHLIEICHRDKASIWVDPFIFVTDQDHAHQQRGFDATTGGIVVGGDYCFDNNILVGIAGGGTYTGLDWSSNRGNAKIGSGFLGIYADWIWKKYALDAALIGGDNSYNVQRNIHFHQVHRKAKNKHHGYDWTAHLGGGIDFEIRPFFIQPFFDVDYSFLHQEGYKENGAKSLNLHVQGKSEQMLRCEEGLYLTRSFETCRGCLSYGVWLSLVTQMHLSNKNYTASLRGEKGTFTVWSYHHVSNRISPGFDLNWNINDSFSLALRWGTEIGQDVVDYKGDLHFAWGF